MRAVERLESSILEMASGHQLPVPSTPVNMKDNNKLSDQADVSDPLLQVAQSENDKTEIEKLPLSRLLFAIHSISKIFSFTRIVRLLLQILMED